MDNMMHYMAEKSLMDVNIRLIRMDNFDRRIYNLIENGAKSRAMAIRWIHEAEETNGDTALLADKLKLPEFYIC